MKVGKCKGIWVRECEFERHPELVSGSALRGGLVSKFPELIKHAFSYTIHAFDMPLIRLCYKTELRKIMRCRNTDFLSESGCCHPEHCHSERSRRGSRRMETEGRCCYVLEAPCFTHTPAGIGRGGRYPLHPGLGRKLRSPYYFIIFFGFLLLSKSAFFLLNFSLTFLILFLYCFLIVSDCI